MAIAFIAEAHGGGNSASASAAKPAGTLDDHGMIAALAVDSFNPTITPPSGWTQVRISNSSAVDGQTLVTYRKVAASEGSSYTWTLGSGSFWALTIVSYSGIDTAAFVDGSTAAVDETPTSSPSTLTGSTITPSVNNCAVLWVAALDPNAGGAMTYTSPSGYTERADVQDGVSNWASVSIAELVQTTATATGSVSGTATHSGSAAKFVHMIVLKPGSGGAGTPSRRLTLLGVG